MTYELESNRQLLEQRRDRQYRRNRNSEWARKKLADQFGEERVKGWGRDRDYLVAADRVGVSDE